MIELKIMKITRQRAVTGYNEHLKFLCYNPLLQGIIRLISPYIRGFAKIYDYLISRNV